MVLIVYGSKLAVQLLDYSYLSVSLLPSNVVFQGSILTVKSRAMCMAPGPMFNTRTQHEIKERLSLYLGGNNSQMKRNCVHITFFV